MAKSSLRHPLAVLRKICEINQSEMADLVKISLATVQSLEVRRLPLSEELAHKIAAVTGVDPVWLLRGDPNVSPMTPAGFAYNQDHFKAARDYKKLSHHPLMKLAGKVDAEESVKKYAPRLHSIFEAASRLNRHNLAAWKMEKFLETMEEAFECAKGKPKSNA